MTSSPDHVTDHRGARDRLVRIPQPRARLRARVLRRSILPRLVASVAGGRLEVRLPDGTTLAGGSGDDRAPHAVIEVTDARAIAQVAARGNRGFGEAFVLGWWTSPDPAAAVEVIARSLAHARSRGVLRLLATVQRLLPTWQRRSSIRSARRDISYHYDLGNDFYCEILDGSMTYSCAEFAPGSDDLLDAQLAKYEGICRRLAISADDHVLEIGCGWGGFAEHVARTRGARVTAVTISSEQYAFARERIRAAGLEQLVEVLFLDYRLLQGSFSRIVSIEMLEAVGAREYPRFVRTVERLLAPDGQACVQVIGFQDRDYERQLRTRGWIRRYVFPGGMLPTPTVLTRVMTRETDLQLHGVRELGMHYGPTLRAWRERLLAAADRLDVAGYGARLRRSWEFYLAYCEGGFRAGHIRVMQLFLAHAGTVAAPHDADRHAIDPGGTAFATGVPSS